MRTGIPPADSVRRAPCAPALPRRSVLRRVRASLVLAGVLVLGGALPVRLRAQSPDWSGVLTIAPSPSPYLSDWERVPSTALLSLTYTGGATTDFRVRVTLTSAERGLVGTSESAVTTVAGGPAAFLYSARDAVFEWTTVARNQALTDGAIRTGQIPEGNYRACARVLVGAALTVATEACSDFSILQPDPPQLLAPADRDLVVSTQPFFQWTPVLAPPAIPVQYEVTVVELIGSQVPRTALDANIPVLRTVAPTPFLIYPIDALPLERTKRYAWRVRAVDDAGRQLFRDGADSEIWSFEMSDDLLQRVGSTKELGDTLVLLPGVAQLTGLRRARLRATETEVSIDGELALEFLGRPGEKVQTVKASALRAGYRGDALTLISGRIEAQLPAGMVPEAVRPFLTFGPLVFTPLAGFSASATLKLPGQPAVPLAGAIQLTAGGLFGRLEGTGANGTPIARIGRAPVQYAATSARLVLPEGRLEFGGQVRLFEQEIGCASSGALAEGVVHLPVFCDPSSGFRPDPNSPRSILAFGTLSGTLAADFLTDTLGTDLRAPATFSVMGDANRTCALDFTMVFKRDAIEREDERSRCAVGEAVADYGWVKLGLSNLRITRLEYEPGATLVWRALVDLVPSVRNADNLQLATIRDVALTLEGVSLPSTSSDAPGTSTSGIVELAEIGVVPRTMGFRGGLVPYARWLGGTDPGLEWGSGTSWIRFPSIGPASSECLNAMPFEVDTLVIKGGHLDAALREKRWESGCRLFAATQLQIRLVSVGGHVTIALDETPRVTVLPTLGGDALTWDENTLSIEEYTPGYDAAPLSGDLRLTPRGRLLGQVDGFAPTWGRFDLRFAKLKLAGGKLDLAVDTSGAQTAIYDGPVVVEVEKVDETPKDTTKKSTETTAASTAESVLEFAAGLVNKPAEAANGTARLDYLGKRLLSGAIPLKGPFSIKIGFVTFILSDAMLDTTGLNVDGRQRTIVRKTTGTTKEGTDGKPGTTSYATKDDTMGVTFARVRVDPVGGDITAGTVTFDGQLALESSPFSALVQVGSAAIGGAVSGGAQGAGTATLETVSGTNVMGFTLVDATGAFDPSGSFGNIRLNLPSSPTWDAQGMRISGAAPANAAFAGSRYDSASVSFENGFAMKPAAGRVTAGRALVKLRQYPIAYLEPAGWRIALAELVQTIIPDTLFLFDQMSAYVVLRDAQRQLLVEVSETNEGPRIRTRAGTPVRIVIPALKGSRQTPPAAEISMDLTLARGSWLPLAGNIKAMAGAGPEDDFHDPDFPFELDSILYDQARGADPRFFVHGRLDLFPGEFSPMKVSLALLGGGELRAEAEQSFVDSLPLVSGSALLKFHIDSLRFTAQGKLGQSFQWRVETPGRLAYYDTEKQRESLLARATFRLSPAEAALLDFRAADSMTVIALPGVDLRLGRARAPVFRWDFVQRRFDFELLFDIGLQIPALDSLMLPEIRDVSITPQGIHIPAFEMNSVPVGGGAGGTVTQLRLGGFSVAALAYRVSDFRWNWFANAPPPQFNFGVDLEFGIEDLPSSMEGQSARIALRALNVGITNGRFTGSFEPIQIPVPIRTPVADIRGAYGSFAVEAGQVPDIRIGLLADLRLPDMLGCPDEAARRVNLDSPNDTLFLASNGTIYGSIRNVIPQCNMALGPFDLRFGTSTVRFGFDAPTSRVTAELAAAVTLRVPSATPGATVSATGQIAVDLVRGRVLDASIAIDQPFFFAPDTANPFLRLVVSQASLTQQELRFGATGQLRTPEGAGIDIAFEDVAFDLNPIAFKSGRIRLTADAAIGIEIPDDGNIMFGVYPPSAPRGATASARLVLPSGAVIDTAGVHISGTATATLAFGGETYAALVSEFANDFTIALGGGGRVGVTRGRINLRDTSNQLIAYVDSVGFWPGNVFAVLPIPARLGIPSVDVAYIQLRNPADTAQLLIETEFGAETVRLRTLPGQMVSVGLPALANGGPVPVINAEFDLVLNSRTMRPVSGALAVEAAPGQSLLPIQGSPIAITQLGFAADTGGFRLRAGARASLPGPLANTSLVFRDIEISAQGLTGQVELGRYSETYDPGLTPIAEAPLLGDTLTLAFTGAILTLDGPNTAVQVSGGIRSALLKNAAGAPRVIHLGAMIGPNGFSGTADLSNPEEAIPIGVAELTIESDPGRPGLAIVATAQEFSLTIGGSLRLPTIAPGFSLGVRDFKIGSAGVQIPNVSITAPANTAEFELFGARFALRDSVVSGQQVAPAIGIEVDGGIVRFELSGYITMLQNTTRFIGLRFGTDGTFSIQGAEFLSRPIDIIPDYARLVRATITNGALELRGDVKLPAPFTTQVPQELVLRITPQGQVTGGGRVVLISETEGLATARTVLRAGVAAFHLRHLDLTLDFATLANNAVSVVADIYVQEKQANLLRVGRVAGGTVTPGLRVALNGDVTFGGIEMPGPIDLDLDPVKLRFTRITSDTAEGGFSLAVTGSLGLKLAGASGSLAFANLGFTSAGEVKVGQARIDGGTFIIQNQVKVIVGQIAWGDADTSIYVPKALPPLGDGQVTVDSMLVNVSSFLSLGAQVEIAGVFKGGVRRFLVYVETDQTTHLLIDRLQVQIPDVIDFVGSFKYDQLADGFDMALAARGNLLSKFEIAMVGMMGQRAGVFRAGLFLRSSVLVPIIPGVVTLTGVGGGLFINPTANDLALVQGIAGFSGPSANRIGMPPAAAFAVMLYASVDVGGTAGAAVASGRAMVTITDQAFQINATATFFNRKDEIKGDLALQVGWVPDVYVRGDVSLILDIKKTVSGTAQIQFFAGGNQFAVKGDVRMLIVEVIQSTAQVIIVPSGFTAMVAFQVGVKTAVVEVGVAAMMRIYSRPSTNDLGAYVKLDGTVKAFGVGAQVTLIGALVIQPEVAIYAQGTAQVIGIDALKIEAWVQYTSAGPAAGIGRNEELAAVIANAEAIAAALELEANQILAGIDAAARERALTPIAVSDASLAAAYRNFQRWNWAEMLVLWGGFRAGEGNVRGGLLPPFAGDPYVSLYEGILSNAEAAADTAIVRQLREEALQKMAVIADRRADVEARIRDLRLQLAESESAAAFIPPADPVQRWDAGNPALVPGPAGPDGRPVMQLANPPVFVLDDQLAGAAQAAMTSAQAATAARAPQLRAQLESVEAGLATVIAATTASDPASFASYARVHSDAVEAVERQQAANVDFRMRRRAWAQGKLDTLAQQRAGIVQRLNDRLTTITGYWSTRSPASMRSAGTSVDLDTIAAHRARYLSAWSQDPSILANYLSAAAEFRTLRSASYDALRADPTDGAAMGNLESTSTFFRTQANSLGVRAWFDVANVGLTAARDGAQALVEQANADAQPVIRKMRDLHANITTQLAELNTRQAELYGVLFDLYDGYLRTYGTADSVGQRYVARKAELAEMLQAPRVTNPTVTVTDFGYLSSVRTTWSGTHPRGVYEYLIQDADDSLFTVGAQGITRRWMYTTDPAGGRVPRNQVVSVRGGAGLTGSMGTPYAVTFRQGSSSNPVSQVATPPVDVTAPSVPIVDFTGLRSLVGPSGNPEFWTGDATRIPVRWSAADAESGIAEYEYRVVTYPVPPPPTNTYSGSGFGMRLTEFLPTPLTPWASAGGRTSMTIQGVTLPANRLVSVEVRAKNGAGLTGVEGGSPVLRYDPTPPTFPAGTTLAYGGRTFYVPTGGFLIGGMLAPLQPACATIATFGSATAQPVWNGRLVTVTPSNTVVGGGATTGVLLGLPAASDAETGIAAYHYRVDATAPTGSVPAEGWTAIPTGGTSFYATGPDFRYNQPRWVSLVAENGAGARSAPVVYGPVTITDATTPSAPSFCADASSSGYIAYMTTPSTDPETGVLGYQMRVRGPTGAIVRDFPAGSAVDWPAAQAGANQGFRLSTTVSGAAAAGMLGGTISTGGRHIVELRAVSGSGGLGEIARSGEVLVDFSPPPVAGVTTSVRASFGSITLTIADDPESGIAGVEIAFGTSPTDPTLTGPASSLVIPYTEVAVGVGTTTVQRQVGITAPLYVYVRVRNGKGLVSAPAVARVR